MKYLFLKLQIRVGEYEFFSTSTHTVRANETWVDATAFSEAYAKDF